MMKPPYSIPTETIWHGAKSLAYRLGAECFGSIKGSSIGCLNEKVTILCAWIYEKVMRPNILALPRTILQKLVLFHVTLNAY